MDTLEVTPIDRARLAQMVLGQLHGDRVMWSEALEQAVEDDRDHSIVTLLLQATHDIATMLAAQAGSIEDASEQLRALLAHQIATAEGITPEDRP